MMARSRCTFLVSLLRIVSYYGRTDAFQRDCPSNSMAQYRMDLRGTWTETADSNARLLHERGFPEYWRWSTGIGVSLDAREDPYYNETVRMKIHNFVTKGGLSQTVSQLSQPGSGVLDSFLIPSMDSAGGETSSIFFVDSNHSRVSFMSRMNKKPYWILSVESVNLCHNGQFRDTFELDLFPFESKPRPSQQQQQQTHMQTPVGPSGAYGTKNSYSIVLPSQSRDVPHRVHSKTFNGQTLVAPLPFPVQQRDTLQPEIANDQAASPKHTLVAPSRLDLQAWKLAIATDIQKTKAIFNQAMNESGYDVDAIRNILLAKRPTTTEPTIPEYVTINGKSHDYVPNYNHQIEPYSYGSHGTDPEKTSPGTSGTPVLLNQGVPPHLPVSFYYGSAAPKLSRRRLPPDSENEVPVIRRRAVRSVRYGIRPRNSLTLPNRTGTYRYQPIEPLLYNPVPPTKRQDYPQVSYPENIKYGRVSDQQQPARKPQLNVLPRLATARFTKIAAYHLSHLLALAKRRLRTGDAPLPITIDKALINSVYRPYPGRPTGHRIPGGMSGRTMYDGMWPSSSVPAVSQRRYHNQHYHQQRRRQHHRQLNPYMQYDQNQYN